MEVILLERVAHLGQMGQKVTVRPGYARNFLFPRKKALRATAANLAVFEAQKAQLEADNAARKVDAQKEAPGMTSISKSQVSRRCAELDERFEAFLNRDPDPQSPYLWLDATYIKARKRRAVDGQAVLVAVAVNTERRRCSLDMELGPAETKAFLDELPARLGRAGLPASGRSDYALVLLARTHPFRWLIWRMDWLSCRGLAQKASHCCLYYKVLPR